ncbi:hypothetical protein JOC85_000188 [Bacillus mesophilus]|uniref:NERD domain-containing protein n=1 Tax=Bacillus mesophilus TaxID=1808955 RepID=A0A6M0Q2A5_9BACI|nr:nuclease-related domain-containing protein [Bacillus mesophilus]MBM7659421.1 hypothetical protein [Bacillus mesophilus]NEY70294.1 NERD domain-containing protein [Bacillus mesophilus]
MRIQKREIPIHIRRLEALSRRLMKSHPAFHKVHENLLRQRAGYQGEKAIDYYLKYLPKEEYLVLHGLRLFDGVGYFQIDYLIISKSFILVIEVKNIFGTLLFDPEFNQCIRISQDKEEGFKDPILQVERQKNQLI